jgi:hypothetical protein
MNIIVIANFDALATLAREGKLGLLEQYGTIMASDYVIAELREHTELSQVLNRAIEIKTGVPAIASDLKALGVNPEMESIRRVIDHLEESPRVRELLVSDQYKYFHADPDSWTKTVTVSELIKQQQREII